MTLEILLNVDVFIDQIQNIQQFFPQMLPQIRKWYL